MSPRFDPEDVQPLSFELLAKRLILVTEHRFRLVLHQRSHNTRERNHADDTEFEFGHNKCF